MPALAKILLVFSAMLLMARLRVQLGLALAGGGIALHLWAGETASETAANLGRSLANPELWLLVAITAFIIEIGAFMTEGRNAEEIVKATRRWGGRRGSSFSLMALPAIIGLVPMPAGALFSAPFIEQAGSRVNGTAAWKTVVNYWFRHVWEYWWPLYPGVIIAMSLFEIEAWRFIATQVWCTPVALLTGYVFLIRPYREHLSKIEDDNGGSNRRALFLFLPIVIIVFSVFVSPFFLPACFPNLEGTISKLLAVLVGLLGAMIVVFLDSRRGEKRKLLRALLTKRALSVECTLAGVLVFKFLLDASGLLPVAGEELLASGIPVVVAVAVLPFVAGLVTGIALGFSGTSFPLVVGLLNTEGSGLTPLATLFLAYGFGYMGMMLSPVHLCLLVTRDYFASSLVDVYRWLWPCAVTVLIVAVGVHGLLRALGW